MTQCFRGRAREEEREGMKEGKRVKERNRGKWMSGLKEGKPESRRGSCKFTGSPLGQVPGPCCLIFSAGTSAKEDH